MFDKTYITPEKRIIENSFIKKTKKMLKNKNFRKLRLLTPGEDSIIKNLRQGMKYFKYKDFGEGDKEFKKIESFLYTIKHYAFKEVKHE